MNKHFSLVLLVLLCAQLHAQKRTKDKYLEVGFLFGLTNYSGDVAERAIEISETQPGYGIFVRYHLNPKLALNAHVYTGSIKGDDKNSPVLYDRKFRFTTNILESALIGEWHFMGKSRYSNTGIRNLNFSPYLFLGVGATFVSVATEYYGPPEKRNDYLRVPFPEDNLKDKFFLLPMGVGLKADILDRFVLGVDVGWRPVFSDDLDGVRINGNQNLSDWYYFVGITASFILTGGR
ncbi:MAG: outer membrane beta-barrel protein [Bacteroidetes bacterium]|nr:outer membrane beta-barrel protein [Bacteroidota bacterium]